MNKIVYLIDYQSKYLTNTQIPKKIDFDIGKPYVATIGDCVKELIEASHKIYSELLEQGPSTIICGGQSPSYYCLAMMNFPIYNPDIVNIVILPHSKGGVKTTKSIDKLNENRMYCTRLIEKDLLIRDNITIIDGVHSGTGILALEDALKFCYPELKSVRKIAINSNMGIAEIPVDKEIILLCEPKFSDTFPRLIQSYHPRDFDKKELFITEFIGLDTNPIANMIIELAKIFPKVPVKETEWYILNHNPTDETNEYAQKNKMNLEIENRRKEGGYFKPIVLKNPKRYQCPSCKSITGTAAPQNPYDLSLFGHNYDCPNKFKIPKE